MVDFQAMAGQEEILGEKKVIANKTRRKLIKFLLALTFSN